MRGSDHGFRAIEYVGGVPYGMWSRASFDMWDGGSCNADWSGHDDAWCCGQTQVMIALMRFVP